MRRKIITHFAQLNNKNCNFMNFAKFSADCELQNRLVVVILRRS